jgi:hypothetical protein
MPVHAGKLIHPGRDDKGNQTCKEPPAGRQMRDGET